LETAAKCSLEMPALYIAKASLDKLAITGVEKIEAYDQTENMVHQAMPIDQNRIVVTGGKIRYISMPSVGWCARRAVACDGRCLVDNQRLLLL
jgi:hypothetical protein